MHTGMDADAHAQAVHTRHHSVAMTTSETYGLISFDLSPLAGSCQMFDNTYFTESLVRLCGAFLDPQLTDVPLVELTQEAASEFL